MKLLNNQIGVSGVREPLTSCLPYLHVIYLVRLPETEGGVGWSMTLLASPYLVPSAEGSITNAVKPAFQKSGEGRAECA